MGFDLIIFDCDGVMFDSREANSAYYNDILAHFGLPAMNLRELDYVHTATTEQSITYLIRDPEIRAKAHQYRLTVDYRPYNRYLKIEPHLIDLLEYLKPERKTAVCTNRAISILQLLEDFGLSRYFDTVVSAVDVDRPKPYPDPLLLVLSRLGVEAKNALYVGDSETDAAAARAAGAPLAIYRNPAVAADFHIQGLDEVKLLVNGA